MRTSLRLGVVSVSSLVFALSGAHGWADGDHHAGQRGRGSFADAPVRYAPDRDYDLKHVAITLDVDYDKRVLAGVVTHTLSPLRGDLAKIKFHAGAKIQVASATVNGAAASVARDGEFVVLTPPAPVPFGKDATVVLRYSAGELQGGGFLGGAGFHWINQASAAEPDRVGFWTQGESDGNRSWVPIWDYPNDFTTTETTVTVPAGWTVVGNGLLKSEKTGAGRATFHWKIDQPHATYLLSLVAGPFDIKKTRWENVPLWYVVPKGKGELIDGSFSDTPKMLDFYSKLFGVKYPWPKYAQNAMYDFGGGMENISATTLGESSLTDSRASYFGMSSLNSHELAHQWFGDYVTCKDWGQIWLNESFATYCEALYVEHRDGKAAYDRDIESNMQAYFSEARRYKRPIATNRYPSNDAMFDSHTYPKGGVVLHTLRKQIGDTGFFNGIRLYLARNGRGPVETHELMRAFTDASGINCQPFFEQWILKPGHPAIEFSWNYDDATGEAVATVVQSQDRADGTPVYTLPVTFGIIDEKGLRRETAVLNTGEQTFRFKLGRKPDAIVFDPDHDFLRQLTAKGVNDSQMAVFSHAPSALDKAAAMRKLLAETPSDDTIRRIADAVAKDTNVGPTFPTVAALGALEKESLRPLWRAQLSHPDPRRRADAVIALGRLSKTPDDITLLRKLAVDPKQPYAAVTASAQALAKWQGADAADILVAIGAQSSQRETLRNTAYPLLVQVAPKQAGAALIAAAKSGRPVSQRTIALRALGTLPGADAPTRDLLRETLNDPDYRVAIEAANAIGTRLDRASVAALRAKAKTPPKNAPAFFAATLNRVADRLERESGS